jgi:vacuolar-type H+-ATPase subunit E/Vma4
MALEEIAAVIAGEGAEELARLAAELASERATILRDAAVEAERRELQEEHALDADRRAKIEARRIAAAHQASRIVGAARERAYQALRTRVEAELEARWKANPRALLAGLLRGAYAALPDVQVVRVHPDDEGVAHELLAELGVAGRVDATLPEHGVVLDAGDGRRADNTLASRIRAAGPRLRQIALSQVAALGD